MKKYFTIGAASLALAAMPVMSTFAIGTGLQTHDVTVGEVDEIIYSVDIEWGNLVFDWQYDSETKEFNFESPLQCSEFISSGLTPALNTFSDNTCNSSVSNPVQGNTYYMKEHINDRIAVYDESENGQIQAQVSFTPVTKYAWITGKIGHYITTTDGFLFEEYDDGILPINGNRAGAPSHYGYLKLEKNTNPTTDIYDTISGEEKIGTITINIEPDFN